MKFDNAILHKTNLLPSSGLLAEYLGIFYDAKVFMVGEKFWSSNIALGDT